MQINPECLHSVVCEPVFCTQNGSTALYLSAYNGHSGTVEVLLGHGARIEYQNKVVRGEADRIIIQIKINQAHATHVWHASTQLSVLTSFARRTETQPFRYQPIMDTRARWNCCSDMVRGSSIKTR